MNSLAEAPDRTRSKPAAQRTPNPAAHPGSHDTTTEHLVFRLGQEEYAINILQVQEIRSHVPPTRLANAPQQVQGVVNLRGTIVPVVDLRMRLGCAAATCDSTTVVMVLNLRGRVVGVVVDSVSDVAAVSPSQVAPAPPIGGCADEGCILGIATLGGGDTERLLILLDIAQLLAVDLDLEDAA